MPTNPHEPRKFGDGTQQWEGDSGFPAQTSEVAASDAAKATDKTTPTESDAKAADKVAEKAPAV